MDEQPRLSTITYTAFSANAALDGGHVAEVSFEDIYRGLDRGTLFRDLDRAIPGEFDFSLFTTGEPDEGRKAIAMLRDAAEALRGRERRKCGVENSGLALLVAVALEAIQQGNWVAPSNWISPRE